jgi:hypothetical protein
LQRVLIYTGTTTKIALTSVLIRRKKVKRMKLELTKLQIENLIEFFELEFIDSIRHDDSVDNMEYLCDMCDVYKKLKEALKNETITPSKDYETCFVRCDKCKEYKPDIIQEGQGFCEVQGEWVGADEGCTLGKKVLQNEKV